MKTHSYSSFSRTGESFSDRVGSPDEISAGLGQIAIWFSCLEDNLKSAVSTLLNIEEVPAKIVVSELSFRALVNIFNGLVLHAVKLEKEHSTQAISR